MELYIVKADNEIGILGDDWHARDWCKDHRISTDNIKEVTISNGLIEEIVNTIVDSVDISFISKR